MRTYLSFDEFAKKFSAAIWGLDEAKLEHVAPKDLEGIIRYEHGHVFWGEKQLRKAWRLFAALPRHIRKSFFEYVQNNETLREDLISIQGVFTEYWVKKTFDVPSNVIVEASWATFGDRQGYVNIHNGDESEEGLFEYREFLEKVASINSFKERELVDLIIGDEYFSLEFSKKEALLVASNPWVFEVLKKYNSAYEKHDDYMELVEEIYNDRCELDVALDFYSVMFDASKGIRYLDEMFIDMFDILASLDEEWVKTDGNFKRLLYSIEHEEVVKFMMDMVLFAAKAIDVRISPMISWDKTSDKFYKDFYITLTSHEFEELDAIVEEILNGDKEEKLKWIDALDTLYYWVARTSK